MSGSFENVGWSRDGKDCLYNIAMMEELHTILSLGGGGITKLNLPDGKLVRFPQPQIPGAIHFPAGGGPRPKEELFRQMKG